MPRSKRFKRPRPPHLGPIESAPRRVTAALIGMLTAPVTTAYAAASNPADADAPPWLLDASGFPPRWQCGEWSSALGWMHIVSDVAIWLAYTTIAVTLLWVLLRRRLPIRGIGWLFIAFIAACGVGHLLEAIIFWEPLYRLAGAWKVVIAVISVVTAAVMIPLIPRILRLPDVHQLNLRLDEELIARRNAEAHLRQIVESAPVGMLLVGPNGRIYLTNREIRRMFGYDDSELIGQLVERLVPAESRDEHADVRDQFFTSPSERRMGDERELCGVAKDGSEIPVDVGLTPIEIDGQQYVLASIADVSAQRDAEAQLRELNDELEARNGELERFVYTVSHDLKSPLVTIQGYIGHLDREVQAEHFDEVAAFTSRIGRAASRLRANIDDLLEMSRIGRVINAPEPTDVAALIDETLQDLNAQIESTGAEIEIADDLPALTTDRQRLGQLFNNLLSNALKYGVPEPGTLRITISGVQHGDRVRFTVADNGPGIPEAYRERVFGLFERLSSNGDGTGVGLAIVRRIAECNHGRVWIDPDVPVGATFHAEFPIEPPANPRSAPGGASLTTAHEVNRELAPSGQWPDPVASS